MEICKLAKNNMVQWFFMIVQDAATSFLTFFFEILSKLNCEETFDEKGD